LASSKEFGETVLILFYESYLLKTIFYRVIKIVENTKNKFSRQKKEREKKEIKKYKNNNLLLKTSLLGGFFNRRVLGIGVVKKA